MSKPKTIEVRPESLEYAPTAGTKVSSAEDDVDDNRNFVPLLPISTMNSIVRVRRVSTPLRYTLLLYDLSKHN